jgi:protein-S-isoprenylcysteine O-methyltransferase Ste14
MNLGGAHRVQCTKLSKGKKCATLLTDTLVTRREHTLITHGPYRWVRHPFYVNPFPIITSIRAFHDPNSEQKQNGMLNLVRTAVLNG